MTAHPRAKLRTSRKVRRIPRRVRVCGAPAHTSINKTTKPDDNTTSTSNIDVRAGKVKETKYKFSDEEKRYFETIFDDTPENIVNDHNAMSAVWRISRLQEAYNKAHDIRKFEIELYWKRNNYFWLMEAVMLTGILFAYNSKSINLTLLVSIGGIVFTTLWICAMNGAKFWQENWEKHIDFLEKPISGKLHLSVWRNAAEKQPSVTRINQYVGYGFSIFWIIAGTVIINEIKQPDDKVPYWFILGWLQAVWLWIVSFGGVVKSSDKKYKEKKLIVRTICF